MLTCSDGSCHGTQTSTVRSTLLLSISLVLMKLEFATTTEELPKLTCKIKYPWSVDSCVHTSEEDARPYVIQEFNKTEGKWNNRMTYTNVSIQYLAETNDIMEIREMKDYGYVVHQRIDLRRNSSLSTIIEVLLEFLPCDSSGLRVAVLKPTVMTTYDPCQLREQEICEKLINTSVVMKPKRNSLQFSITQEWDWGPLVVEMYDTPGELNCNNISTTENSTAHQWTNPNTEMVIGNLKASNYCARVKYTEQGVDCCSIFTGTVYLHPDDWAFRSNHDSYISIFFWWTAAPLLLVVFIACALIVSLRGNPLNYSHRRGSTTHNRKDAESNDLVEDAVLVHRVTQETEMFLVYPKGNEDFMGMMRAFRKYLSVYATKVWDAHDRTEVEDVAANPGKWLLRLFQKLDLKIVLVEPEDAGLSSEDELERSDNEDIYFSVLSYIINNPSLAFDYRRLFVVRFDGRRIQSSLIMMVPEKRYKMPRQLGLLISDVTDYSDPEVYPIDSISEVKELCGRVQAYQETVCQGPPNGE